MANEPGFTPVDSGSGGTPGFTPLASDSGASAQPSGAAQTPTGPSASGMAGGALDKLSDFWGKLTASYNPKTAGWADQHPTLGRVAQGLDTAGGALMAAPQMAAAGVRDAAKFVQNPYDPTNQTVNTLGESAQAWADPKTRPTMGQIGEVAPEAIGAGIGGEVGGRMTSGALSGAAHFMQMASDPVIRQTFKELSDAGSQHAAIMQGKVRTVNDLVRKPASLLQDAVMGENGEVGQHANAVLAADEADMQSKGSQTGMADTAAAVHAARETLKQNMGTEFGSGPIEGWLQRAVGPMSLRNLKALRTQVGKVAGSMYRGGGRGEAAALYSLYDGLTDAGNARAGELGSQAASSWNHYSDVTASYKEMEKGLLGDMLDPASHTTDTAKASLLSQVVNNPSGLKEITNSMKKYGVDPEPLQKAVGIGRSLNDATARTGNIVMAKIKSMIKHPLAVGAPAIAGGMAGSAMGLSGGLAGFVLPIAIAYHLNGILDKVQLTKILSDVKKTTIDTSVTGELPDRQAPPPPPSSAQSTQQPTQAPPSGPSSTGGDTSRGPGVPMMGGRPGWTDVTSDRYRSPASAATASVERRSPQASSGYFGPERRTVTPQIGTPGERGIKLAKTPGEELAEQWRQARAGKSSGITEADAQQQLKKDPAAWAKYRQLREGGEGKAADVMLIKAKRELEGARK